MQVSVLRLHKDKRTEKQKPFGSGFFLNCSVYGFIFKPAKFSSNKIGGLPKSSLSGSK